MHLSTLFYLLQGLCLNLLRRKLLIHAVHSDLHLRLAQASLNYFKVPELLELDYTFIVDFFSDHTFGIVYRVFEVPEKLIFRRVAHQDFVHVFLVRDNGG